VKATLSARGLHKHFDGVVAAEDVSLEVAAGERVGLIGSNGAGKTTFVNMVTGYLKPDSGRIEIEGADITGLGPRQIVRRGVARSFQVPQLYPELSVMDNVLAAAACTAGRLSFWRPANDAGSVARARAILERFSLAVHEHRRVAELAGGVRKLLDIAMALTRHPSLLLLDEPTSGVSAEEKFPVMDTVMAALEGERAAVLFVEHDMEIVQRYASRVVAFYSGRILADGPPGPVLADPEVRRHVTGAEA